MFSSRFGAGTATVPVFDPASTDDDGGDKSTRPYCCGAFCGCCSCWDGDEVEVMTLLLLLLLLFVLVMLLIFSVFSPISRSSSMSSERDVIGGQKHKRKKNQKNKSKPIERRQGHGWAGAFLVIVEWDYRIAVPTKVHMQHLGTSFACHSIRLSVLGLSR